MKMIEKIAVKLPAGLVAGKKEVAKASLAAFAGAGLGYVAGRMHKKKKKMGPKKKTGRKYGKGYVY